MKILIAIDGSECSSDTVAGILQIPWPPDTKLRVLTVAEQKGVPSMLEVMSSGGSLSAVREDTKSIAEAISNSAAAELRSAGHAAEAVVLEGDPKKLIPEAAAEWGADLVVVGCYGHSGVKRLLVGSVAQAIAATAPCSVLIVRRRQDSETAKTTRRSRERR